MGEQLNFEEGMDWLRDVSQGTDKHLFTHSEVSQEHFLEELLQQPPLPPRNALKEKGKLNAKNYRDRKKHQNDAMKRQIELLQHENALLRNEKYCRWCRKSYLPTVCLSHTAPPKSAHIQQSAMEAEFEKPDLFGSKGEQRRGRIWIAVGLLMLVLGLSLYGVRGEGRYVRQIELEKEAVGKWAEQFKNKGEDYIDVKMRIKEERRPIVKVEPTELRILYRPAATAEMKYEEMAEEETVSINKELLFSIHAELDDIGMYR